MLTNRIKNNIAVHSSLPRSKRKMPFFSAAGKNSKPFFQPKLTIGPVNDVYEREADAVADQVIRMAGNQVMPTNISPLGVQRMCAECEEEEKEKVQRNANPSTPQEAPAEVQQAIHSGGQPMDEGTRSFMENRFGYDFSQVKIHTDTVAAKSADAINSLAYTRGNNIVFNEGQYTPDTVHGKKLLAHELTHVVQQRNTTGNPVQRRDFGPAGGKCCNQSSGQEWALIGNGTWMRLEAGECSPFMEDCDGITCGGGFYHTSGAAGTFLFPSICRTPRNDDWYFRERRWTPTSAGSEAMSPTSRGASSDYPPGYQYD